MEMNDIERAAAVPAGAAADAAPAVGAYQMAGIWTSSFNRRSFRFGHSLAQHPLFALPSLAAVARRRADNIDLAYWSNGKVAARDRWEKGWNSTASLADTIAGIRHNQSLVMLRHVEDDPLLGPLVRELFSSIVALSGPRLKKDVVLGKATILLASPNRVTPYHIDADSNFLLQISGSKQLSIFDPQVPPVTGDEEYERFFAGDFNGAVLKDKHQALATTYRLEPGDGVHIPWTAPHWGCTGDQVSVALSLAYDLRSGYRKAKIYQINRRLRRYGLEPASPGLSWWKDLLKLAAKNLWLGLRFVLGQRPDPSTLWGWRPVVPRSQDWQNHAGDDHALAEPEPAGPRQGPLL